MNILFTSAGRRGYLVDYFTEALGNQGEIHVANSSPHSIAMKYGHKSVVTPLIHDVSYIPFLTEYCLEHQIDMIIPLFDVDLPVLSKKVKEFEEIGVMIIVSSEEVIRICNDKWETFNFLRKNGIPTPLTFLSISEAITAIRLGHVSFPLIIKPRWGMGSIAVYEADNVEELIILYTKVKHSIDSTYLSYESKKSIEHCIVIQEKLVGQEYGLDIINDLEGDYRVTIMKKKHSMRSGETDYAETVDQPDLEKLGEQLGKATRHISNLDVDAFIVNGVPYILEMNARFGGGYPFSHIAGVNLPKAILAWGQGEQIEKSLLEAKIGVVGYKELTITEYFSASPVLLM